MKFVYCYVTVYSVQWHIQYTVRYTVCSAYFLWYSIHWALNSIQSLYTLYPWDEGMTLCNYRVVTQRVHTADWLLQPRWGRLGEDFISSSNLPHQICKVDGVQRVHTAKWLIKPRCGRLGEEFISSPNLPHQSCKVDGVHGCVQMTTAEMREVGWQINFFTQPPLSKLQSLQSTETTDNQLATPAEMREVGWRTCFI